MAWKRRVDSNIRVGYHRGMPLHEYLSFRDGELFLDDVSAGQVAREFGTPVFAMSETQLRRDTRRWRQALEDAWPDGPTALLPAFKANTCLALRHVLNEEGVGCDTFGEHELRAALSTGADPACVSLNGTNKSEEAIRLAIEHGVRITLDSLREVEMVSALSGNAPRPALVRLRLRPGGETLTGPSDFSDRGDSIAGVAAAYRPGFALADAERAARSIVGSRGMRLVGTHTHLGRHTTSLAAWAGVVSDHVRQIARISAACGGWRPSEIDLGGGYAERGSPVGQAIAGREAPQEPPPPEQYTRVIAQAMRAAMRQHGFDSRGVALQLEPGRAIYGPAGVHLTRVVNVRRSPERPDRRWVELDTTEQFLADVVLEHARYPFVLANRVSAAPSVPVDLTGASCGFDIIAAGIPVPEDIAAGDLVALLNTGAYAETQTTNFNAFPRPATVLLSGDLVDVIRRAETPAEVFSRDRVPARLLRSEDT
ncbi:alanine racemase [Dactylosporangium sp. AC04546]|uniref:diaminopimelate decarboxylase family protein n=1 Tax=Dactylosporangium sp. AC04546 TaxID=2862460 RepID=UPI001EE1240A|nr:alanine racemase [Dactylosporangium sp. AC04546]WVK80967.1 alanine racemase [Dactylosporangium sp. AC04546]